MTRLGPGHLRDARHGLRVPQYDRGLVRTGVVHLGLGAFHRAHQATILERALAGGDLRWGILGVSIRSPRLRRVLQAQDGLYTVVERYGDAVSAQVVGALRGVEILSERPRAVIEALAAPDTRIVTLTVTEKAYRRRPGGGGTPDLEDVDIRHDLALPLAPRTIPGLLLAGLARRRQRGSGGVHVMSCDNLPGNGAGLRDSVLLMARQVDAALQDWIAREVRFPSTMVDRIVPATTPEDVALFAQRTGITDPALVKTEPFLQWVIEDSLGADVPDFGALGVTLTRDVGAWELAKLRVLNAAHSLLAYTGLLAGHGFIHQAAGTTAGRALLEALWDETATTLRPTAGLDAAAYRRAILGRFGNTALCHRLDQIAADGTQKLPPRIIAPLAERLARAMPSPALIRCVAAWLVCLADGPGMVPRIELVDPDRDRVRGLLRGDAREQVAAVMTGSGLFGPLSPIGPELVEDVARDMRRLRDDPHAPLPPPAPA